MKKINHSLLASVSGAAVDPANQEVIKQMSTNMAYGAGWGLSPEAPRELW